MKKALLRILIACGFIVGIVFSLSNYFHDEMRTMPKYKEKKCYYDKEQFRDYTDYCKYYYNDNKINQFKNDKRFKKVEEKDMQELREFLENYNGWVKSVSYYKDYDFDYQTQIKLNDYFYLNIKDPDNKFHNYDIYYFDTKKGILYFFHSNT